MPAGFFLPHPPWRLALWLLGVNLAVQGCVLGLSYVQAGAYLGFQRLDLLRLLAVFSLILSGLALALWRLRPPAGRQAAMWLLLSQSLATLHFEGQFCFSGLSAFSYLTMMNALILISVLFLTRRGVLVFYAGFQAAFLLSALLPGKYSPIFVTSHVLSIGMLFVLAGFLARRLQPDPDGPAPPTPRRPAAETPGIAPLPAPAPENPAPASPRAGGPVEEPVYGLPPLADWEGTRWLVLGGSRQILNELASLLRARRALVVEVSCTPSAVHLVQSLGPWSAAVVDTRSSGWERALAALESAWPETRCLILGADQARDRTVPRICVPHPESRDALLSALARV